MGGPRAQAVSEAGLCSAAPRQAGTEIFDTTEIVAPIDFNLADATENRELAKKLLKKKTESIQDSADYEIVRSSDTRNGNIALVHKHSHAIDRLVHYAVKHYTHIGKTVTQLKLSRRRGSLYAQGVTKHVFYSYLLQNYPMIMSDGQQTDDGRKFWLDRMAEATTLGYSVGLVNLYHRKVAWFDPNRGNIRRLDCRPRCIGFGGFLARAAVFDRQLNPQNPPVVSRAHVVPAKSM
jgi:hypothetical protein